MGEGCAPEVGALVRDRGADRLGFVMDHLDSRVRLRPPGGGTEWEADPADLVSATTGDELRVRVAEERARRW